MFRTRIVWIANLLVLAVLALAGCGAKEDPPRDRVEVGDRPGDGEFIRPRGDRDGGAPRDGGKGRADRQVVQFLGVEGQGRRFCIIADSSSSLGAGSFNLIKQEILKTLDSLEAESQFHLMFFSSKTLSNPGGDWLFGKRDVEIARPWINAYPLGGGTVPAPAFQKAFTLVPKPDVIFFMTDGLINPADPSRVAVLNVEPKVPINTILFTRRAIEVPPTDRARQMLEQIARESGGIYRQFIDPTALPGPGLPGKGKFK